MGSVRYSCMVDVAKLKRERDARGLTMAQAAKLAGMQSAQAWDRVENGDGLSLTLRTLNTIASGLKIPAKDLLR
jgi:transcriptional regulator with XRE-family HTH domain